MKGVSGGDRAAQASAHVCRRGLHRALRSDRDQCAVSCRRGRIRHRCFSTRIITHSEPQKPDDLVRAVQDALKQVGYYSGPLDGIMGPRTHAAITVFEVKTGREETGEASWELLTAIKNTDGFDLAPAPLPADAPSPSPAIVTQSDPPAAEEAAPASDPQLAHDPEGACATPPTVRSRPTDSWGRGRMTRSCASSAITICR